ncbi:MAG: hypothetical protein ACI924_002535, partial [Flavobacterium sp.]
KIPNSICEFGIYLFLLIINTNPFLCIDLKISKFDKH